MKTSNRQRNFRSFLIFVYHYTQMWDYLFTYHRALGVYHHL